MKPAVQRAYWVGFMGCHYDFKLPGAEQKYPQKVQESCFVGVEEIHFKLYKRYQKEEEILPFKNSRTALQNKKLKITGVLVKKNNNDNNKNKN